MPETGKRMTGQVIEQYEQLEELFALAESRGTLPVVVDQDRCPWILFCTEDGDAIARAVVPQGEPEQSTWECLLLPEMTAVVVWDGWIDYAAS